MDAAEQITEQAQELLLTYYKHLHTKGREVAELRTEGVSWSRIANLYPWDVTEWSAAFNRLTRSKAYWVKPAEYEEGRWVQHILALPQFTEASWKAIRSLMILRLRSAPAFAQVDEATHGRYVRIGQGRSNGADPYVYLEALVWVLHVLATSPAVSNALTNERERRAARAVLAKAQELSAILDRPQPQPEARFF